MESKKFILTISCTDTKGIVAKITGAIFSVAGNIITLDQFSDPNTKQFFFRSVIELEGDDRKLRENLTPICSELSINWSLESKEKKKNLIIMCSKEEHCLNDLLQKHKRGTLNANISAIVCNHRDLEHIAKWYDLPFYHLPITKETKPEQEKKLKALVNQYCADYIILARYMQIISEELCSEFEGRIINIHHSFLPAFIGAKPYHQAYKRGVKLIGATAHFVTADLDEGPIIAQETIRVNHANTVEELIQLGSDIEALVLSRAVKQVLDSRVFIDMNKTVVLK